MPLSTYLPSFVTRLFSSTASVEAGPSQPVVSGQSVEPVRDALERGPSPSRRVVPNSGVQPQIRAPQKVLRFHLHLYRHQNTIPLSKICWR